nr:hypothetical protein Iba_chr07cCG6880 [Ipomoea batatas]
MVAYRTGHNSGLARKSAGSTLPDTIRFGFKSMRVELSITSSSLTIPLHTLNLSVSATLPLRSS